MRLINIPVNGSSSSMMVPPNCAAWTLILNEDTGEGCVLFRRKQVTETSYLTSLNNARKEQPGYSWASTSGNPTAETSGGVDSTAALYERILLLKREGRWRIDAEPGMAGYLLAQADLRAGVAGLPKTSELGSKALSDLLSKMKAKLAKK